jgi:hypothetical protein
VADRRIFQPVDHLARLGGGAERAIVQGAGRDRVFAARHAGDGRDAGIERGGRDLGAGSSDITLCSMSRNSQSNPATAIALAISTLRVMRMPTPSDR